MESTEITTVSQPQNLFVSPIVGMAEAKAKFEQVRQFTADCLTKGVDYGNVPGVSKPSLLKPGAEKIGSLFGLTPRFKLIDKIMNWTGEGNPDNEPFFYFEYKCELYRAGEFVASCDASCNSWEKKYRYRKADLVCPKCGKATIIKGKKDYGGGWICYGKKGGCGAKFADNDPQITKQATGEVKNFDSAEQVNTFQKMAQKRAYVGAILIACNLSEYYTQDVEDMASFATAAAETEPAPEMLEADYTPLPPEPEPAPAPKKKPFDEMEFLRSFSKPAAVQPMNRAKAETYTAADGTPYKDMTTRELYGHWIGLSRKHAAETDPEAQNEIALSIAAICEILQNRKLEKTLPQTNDDPFVKGA